MNSIRFRSHLNQNLIKKIDYTPLLLGGNCQDAVISCRQLSNDLLRQMRDQEKTNNPLHVAAINPNSANNYALIVCGCEGRLKENGTCTCAPFDTFISHTSQTEL